MTHPGPMLTDYVDGTLPPKDVARVEAHLRSCATCRQEVRLAAAGRDALADTIVPAAPAGLAEAAIAEAAAIAGAHAPEVASLGTPASQRPRPATPRWLAIAGAAAAIVLIAIMVPKLGQPGTTTRSEAAVAGGAQDVAHPAATAVEIQDVDYGADILDRVAATYDRAFVGAAPVEGAASGSALPQATLAGPETAVKLSAERLPAATRCLARAYPDQGGTLTRAILARYEGEPAYLGVYLLGPGGGLPPDVVLVVVASVDGCEPLTTGQYTLP